MLSTFIPKRTTNTDKIQTCVEICPKKDHLQQNRHLDGWVK